MNVQDVIKNIKTRPEMYISEKKLIYIYYFLKGFLYNNLATSRADKIDISFKYEFYLFVSTWIAEHLDIHESGDISWEFFISNVTNNDEEAINLFFKLSEEFFMKLQGND